MSSTPTWVEQYVAAKRLDDERWLVVSHLTFGRARIIDADASGPTGDFY